MANALATELSSLTFDGVDLQRSNLTIHLEVTQGLWELPEVRGEDSIVPGLNGRIPRNRVRDRRMIVLAGWVQGTGANETDRLASFTNLMDELDNLFRPDMFVSTADPILTGTAWDGTTRSIAARPISLLPGPSPIPGVRPVTVTLEAVEPDWTGGEGS